MYKWCTRNAIIVKSEYEVFLLSHNYSLQQLMDRKDKSVNFGFVHKNTYWNNNLAMSLQNNIAEKKELGKIVH